MSRIDDSHQPYKRTRKIGPGPKKRAPVLQVGDWECKRGPKKYTQVCVYVGDNRDRRGTKVKKKLNAKKKKAYNKIYRAWAKKNRAALAARGQLPTYRCRRTAAAKCK
jgi:hypothetical protein